MTLASIVNLKNFLATHRSHGWVEVTNNEELQFPQIADTHMEFICPCTPGMHYTVARTDNPERPAYHLKG